MGDVLAAEKVSYVMRAQQRKVPDMAVRGFGEVNLW
jgi:hypothetical protein